jgi:hypothetical protein
MAPDRSVSTEVNQDHNLQMLLIRIDQSTTKTRLRTEDQSRAEDHGVERIQGQRPLRKEGLCVLARDKIGDGL